MDEVPCRAPHQAGAGRMIFAIQGERGSFSHAAARRLGGDGVDVLCCRAFDDLFASVVDGRADAGAVPVENTLAGAVTDNLDLLARHDLFATGETRVRVELCFVTRPDRHLADVTTVASHPVALRQCRSFLERHPHLGAVPAWDTAGSVRDLMEGTAAYDAAIGSALAAELYGGAILVAGIEDDPANHTRFLRISARAAPRPLSAAKASMIFTLAHRPGSLHAALGCFAERGVDLCRLESRPIPGRPWEYRFHLDATAGTADAIDTAAEGLRSHAHELKVLGCWAVAAQDAPGS